MPAPRLLAILPKPILFGLYGAIGGLLGALVFGEPAWQILKPPPPKPSDRPEPQLAVSASKELQLLIDRANSFAVEIERLEFDEPVEVKVEDLPAGITATALTLAKGEKNKTGKVTLQALGSVSPSTSAIKVVASATVDGKKITAETKLDLTVVASPAPQADVFFVLDVTGSMEWAINGVRDGIGSFAAKMRENKIDFRIGLLAFRDITHDPVNMDLLLFGDDTFTTDVAAFKNQVGRLVSMGGGDIPESSLEAVELACKQRFRKGATKVLLLITDAPPKVKSGQNIPQTEDEALAGVRKTAAIVKDSNIDAVHLVVREFNRESSTHDREIYKPLMEAGLIKGGGQYFDLEQVARGTAGFTSLIDKFTSAVVEAAAAKNPVKPTVAAQAEKPVLSTKSLQSSEQYAAGSEHRLLLMSAIWTGAIAALVCFTLLTGQHHYLRGSLPSPGAIIVGLIGGMLAGALGGACGYELYQISPNEVFRVLGWSLLGGLAGVGLSLFIPNLKWVHGLAGGAIGGACGGVGFIVLNGLAGKMIGGSFGDVIGRLSGGLIVGFCIGLMVAIVEAAFRRAWLEVRYGARETITVNLGPEPVKIGGDNRLCTVWARGAVPVALRYFIRSGQVVCEDTPNRAETVVNNGDSKEVGNVTVTVRTGSSAVPAGTSAPRTTAAPPLPRVPVPPTSPKELKPLGLDPFDDDPLPPPAPPQPTPKASPRPSAAPTPLTASPKPPLPTGSGKPPVPPPAPPKPVSPPPAAKPASGPRDPEACPSCGRKNPGRPGSRFCMLCDQTY
jgi:Mg-chelatase subunit ChlD